MMVISLCQSFEQRGKGDLGLHKNNHNHCHFDAGEISERSSTKIGLLLRSYLWRFLLRRNDKMRRFTLSFCFIRVLLQKSEALTKRNKEKKGFDSTFLGNEKYKPSNKFTLFYKFIDSKKTNNFSI